MNQSKISQQLAKMSTECRSSVNWSINGVSIKYQSRFCIWGHWLTLYHGCLKYSWSFLPSFIVLSVIATILQYLFPAVSSQCYCNFFLSLRLITPSFNILWIRLVNLLNILDKIRQQRTLLQGLQNTWFRTNSNSVIRSNQCYNWKSAGLARNDQKKKQEVQVPNAIQDYLVNFG